MAQSAVILSKNAPKFYGGNKEIWAYQGPEVILDGPYETGKTFAALSKLHALLSKYPNCNALMARKTRKSMLGSAVVTYENKVLPYKPTESTPIHKYGGERPEFYIYPNGSKLTVGGLDDPDKYLSAEYDYIYIPQAEEISLNDWEKLCGRATGRAANAPYPQVIGDVNPGPPNHWILQRQGINRIRTTHKDNPTLFDHETNDWTERGKTTIARLSSLTGLRYKRGFLGLWAGAEGVIYEFDDSVHVVEPFPIPASWTRYRSIDFGYTNPFVCQWWAVDPDGRMYMYRELYMSQRTVREHADAINRLTGAERIRETVADHDAEDRATLREHGIDTVAADKRVQVGIEKAQDRLRIAKDGKPRLMIFRDCLAEVDQSLKEAFKPVSIIDEFGSYIWEPGQDGKPNKEQPQKLYDHSLDAARYMVMRIDAQSTVAVSSGRTVSRKQMAGMFS